MPKPQNPKPQNPADPRLINDMSYSLFKNEQLACFSVLVLLSVIGIFSDKIPIQINITIHSMAIIAIGSFKSVEEMMRQIKRIHVD